MFSSKYSPVQVNNPQDGHMVVLLPNQQLIVNLAEASTWNHNTLPRTAFEVSTSSPFIVKQVEKHLDAGSTEYVYEQLYDLTSWCKYGTIYLGEVHIVLRNKKTTLCVYCRTSSTNDVVTVINPSNYEVKIEPNQILEVVINKEVSTVIMDKDYTQSNLVIHGKESDLWKSGTTFVEKLREEVVFCPESSPHREDDDPYKVIDRSVANLPINPTLTDTARSVAKRMLERRPTTATMVQRHYWLRLNPLECQAIVIPEKKCFVSNLPLASLAISISEPAPAYMSFKKYSVNLSLCHRGLTKHGLPKVVTPDAIKEIGRQKGFSDQYHSPKNNLLVNPSRSVSHELLISDGGLCLELALPSTMHPTSVEYPNLVWDVSASPIQTTGSLKKIPRLAIMPLPSRYINNKKIQRFMIMKDKTVVTENYTFDQTLFLGVINIKCDKLSVLGEKIIHMWEVRKKTQTVDTKTSIKSSHKIIVPKSKNAALAIVPPTRMLPYSDEEEAARWVNYRITPPEQRTFTKIVITEQFDDITAGTDVSVFADVVNKVFEEDHKNKRHQRGHEHSSCAYKATNESKKKETRSNHSSSLSLIQSVKEEVRKVKQSQISPGSNEDKVFMIDPKDGDYEVIKFNQDLIIRLPVIFWGIDQDIQHLWMPTILCPGNPKIRITSQRMISNGDKGYLQEIVVKLIPLFIRENKEKIGEHFAGGIRFENVQSYFTVVLWMDVNRPIAESEIGCKFEEQMDMYRELIKVRKIAMEDMEAERKKQHDKIVAKAKEPTNDFGGMTISLTEPIGSAETLVGINDRVKIVLKNDNKKSSWDIGGIPDWLDLTLRRQSEFTDVFEFEPNPKAFNIGMKAEAELLFVHIQGDKTTRKQGIKMRLRSPHVKATMPAGVLG